MTDTAKPTGPYTLRISPTQPLVALWSYDANGVMLEAPWRHGFLRQRDLPCEEAIENLELAKDAFEVHSETNITPRQLVEQRDALRRELDDALLTIKSIKSTIEHIERRLEAALAKKGEVK